MNQNTILAALVVKKVITEDEANKLSEHLANVPQSTIVADAIEQVEELFGVKPDKKSAEKEAPASSDTSEDKK